MLTSKKRANTLASILFLVSLLALPFLSSWWPSFMLAIGFPLALRQFLLGRTYDALLTLLVFGGTFITIDFDISWDILLPVLFTLGSLYIAAREFLISPETEAEEEEELNHEIEEK
jgi:hypothetical protein